MMKSIPKAPPISNHEVLFSLGETKFLTCALFFTNVENTRKILGPKLPREILHVYMQIQLPKLWDILILVNTSFSKTYSKKIFNFTFYFTTDFHLKKTISHTKAYERRILFSLPFYIDSKIFFFAQNLFSLFFGYSCSGFSS